MNRHCCSEIKCMYYGTHPDVNLIDPEVISGPLTDPVMWHCMCVTKHSLTSFVAYLFGIVPPLRISVFQQFNDNLVHKECLKTSWESDTSLTASLGCLATTEFDFDAKKILEPGGKSTL